jgi:2-polyprenyl-6-methoxyphenol hydroxylase-like FAD-dependent oxidoreductase
LRARNGIVILGGGTGGTLLANRLRRANRPEAADLVVVDRDDTHVYQPGLLFVPFGLPLLRPSRLNHLGKLAFQPFYWRGLLPGRDIPGIGPAMPVRGKSRG